MGARYLFLGSGMQGTAAAFHIAKEDPDAKITMADHKAAVATTAADRLQKLLGGCSADSLQVDARDDKVLRALLENYDSCFSAIDYELNPSITRSCIVSKTHMVDLGGNTDVVLDQLTLHESALEAGVSIVPDCGLAPGLGNTLASAGINALEDCQSVQVRCGGLPQNPKPPLNYMLVFNIKGLTNEYFGKAWILRDSKRQEIDTFSELEEVNFPNSLGKLEAFVTTGGSSTCPWTFEGQIKDYDYKTLRYPGHFEKFKVMLDLGLLDTEPVKLGDTEVKPRDLFHAVVPKYLSFPEEKDLVALRVVCRGKSKSMGYEMIDYQDDATGFSAMERGTGFPAAHVLLHATQGKTKKGVVPLEKALNEQELYLEELSKSLPIKKIEEF